MHVEKGSQKVMETDLFLRDSKLLFLRTYLHCNGVWLWMNLLFFDSKIDSINGMFRYNEHIDVD